jgi:hypothetical protein
MGTGQEDISNWLRTQVEFINKMVREAPCDTLSLPTDGLEAEPKTPEEPRRVCDSLVVEESETDLESDQIDVVSAAGNIQAPDVGPSAPVENPLEAERRERRKRFFRGECDAL